MKKLTTLFILALLSINNLYGCAPVFHAFLFDETDSNCGWGRSGTIQVTRKYQVKWSDNVNNNSGDKIRGFGQCFSNKQCLPDFTNIVYEDNGSFGDFEVEVINKKQVGSNLQCVTDFVSTKIVRYYCAGVNGCNSCDLSGGEDSLACLTENLEEGGCCSQIEASDCVTYGGIWNASTCTCISPIVIDVAGNFARKLS